MLRAGRWVAMLIVVAMPMSFAQDIDDIGVGVISQTWRNRSGFAHLDVVTFNNRKTVAMKDVQIECDFFGRSGTKIVTRRITIFDIFPPGRSIQRDLDMGFVGPQAASINCSVSDSKKL